MLMYILVIFFERFLKGTKSKERTNKFTYYLSIIITYIANNRIISLLTGL